MENNTLQWQDETDAIIQELLDDGSDPDAIYTIEHHFASRDFQALEKAAVNCFKAGFDVTDAEEIELDDGAKVMSFDVIIEMALEGEQIKLDIEKLAALVANESVFYDGWGTYFEGDEDFDDDESFEDDD
ncbi:ribonuclease E inhibitor RraB [Celerinatantimonas yamalensis]|uniref:Regulator of ribonuclease activity B n=1 Tax=Celerinatantimonas yamalensis TaxID=559956 RepID=A0ABW9G623_9GAMM